MMNTINSVSSSTQNIRTYVSQVKPAMYLSQELYQAPEQVDAIKNNFHDVTPEQLNTLSNNVYDARAEKEALDQDKKETIWEAAVAKKYAESQKETVNAYAISATGESVYDNESQALSITETYMNLKDFQDEIAPLQSAKSQLPANDVTIMPVDKRVEANVEQYQRTQYERVNSLLHLSA